MLFYAAAAEFEECRAELRGFRYVIDDVVRCLFYAQLPNLIEASLKVGWVTNPRDRPPFLSFASSHTLRGFRCVIDDVVRCLFYAQLPTSSRPP